MASPKTGFLARFQARLQAQEEQILGASNPTGPAYLLAKDLATALQQESVPADSVSTTSFANSEPILQATTSSAAISDARQAFHKEIAAPPMLGYTNTLPVPNVVTTRTFAHQPPARGEEFGGRSQSGSIDSQAALISRPPLDRQTEQIRSLLATVQAMTDDAARQQSAALESARALDMTRRQAAEANGRVAFLEAELTSVMQESEQQVADLQTRLSLAQSEIAALRAAGAASAAGLQGAGSGQHGAVGPTGTTSELDALRQRREDAASQKEKAMLAAQLSEAQADASEVRAALAACQAELRTAQAKAAKSVDLEQENRGLTAARDTAMAAATSAKAELQRGRAEFGERLAELQKALASTASRLSAAKTDRDRVTAERDALTSEVEALKAQLAAAQSAGTSDGDAAPGRSVRFQLPGESPPRAAVVEGATADSGVTATAPAPAPAAAPTVSSDMATESNMMALMLYAQKLEDELSKEKRRSAASRIVHVLQAGVARSLRAKLETWGNKAKTGSGSDGDGVSPGSLGSPIGRGHFGAHSPSTSHLELLAATPLASLGLHVGPGAGSAVTGQAGFPVEAHAGHGVSLTSLSALSEAEQALQEVSQAAVQLATGLHATHGPGGHMATLAQTLIGSTRKAIARLSSLKTSLQARDGGREVGLSSTMSSLLGTSTGGMGPDPNARLRQALSAANARADAAEAEALSSAREANELRLQASALQTSLRQLFSSLGLPQQLGTTRGRAGSSSSSSGASAASLSPYKADDGNDTIAGLDAGLLDAGSFGTRLSFGAHASPGAGRPSSTPFTQAPGPVAVTPEAIIHAANVVAALRAQIESVQRMVDGVTGVAADQPGRSQGYMLQLLQTSSAAGESLPVQELLMAARAAPLSLQAATRRLESSVKVLHHRSRGDAGSAASGSSSGAGASASDGAAAATILAEHDVLVAALTEALSSDSNRLSIAETSKESIRAAREEADHKARETARSIAELQGQLEASSRLVKSTQAEVERYKEVVQGCEARISSLNADIEGLRAELEVQKETAAKARADADQLRHMTRQTLTDARQHFTAEADSLARDREAAVSRVTELEADLARARADADAESRRLRADAASREAALSAEFQRQLSERAAVATAEVEGRVAEVSAGHKEALTRLQALHADEITRLRTSSAEERAALIAAHERELTATMAGAEERVASLSKELSELRATMAELVPQLEATSAELARVKEALHAREEELEDRTAALDDAYAELDELKLRAEQLTNVLSNVTSELETQMAAASDAKTDCERWQSMAEGHVQAAKTELELLRTKAASVVPEAADMDSAVHVVESCVRRVEALDGRVHALAQQLEEMRQEADEEVEAVKQEMTFAMQAADEHAKAYVARMVAQMGIKQ